MRRVRQGAAEGFLTWTAYAAVEYFFGSVAEMAVQRDLVLPDWHLRLNLLAFGCYAAAGVVLGITAELIVVPLLGRHAWWKRAGPDRLRRSVVLATLLISFLANMLWQHRPDGVTVLEAVICLLLTAAIVVGLRAGPRPSRLDFLVSRWTASVLLAGSPWAIQASGVRERFGAFLVAAGFCIAITLLAFLADQAWRRNQRGTVVLTPPRWGAVLARTIPLFAVLLAAAWVVDQWIRAKEVTLIPAPSRAASPNVILLVWDTVRADHLSAYGYARDTTPNLKRLAKEASLYSLAISPSNYTLSSHASLFTGLYASWHGVTHVDRILDPNYSTLAEILSKNGYATAEIAANPGFLSDTYGMNQGFQYSELVSTLPFLSEARTFWLRSAIARLFEPFAYPELWQWARPAWDINQSVFRAIDTFKLRGGPYFLFVNYMDAHFPTRPPPPFDTLYEGKDRTVRFLQVKREVLSGSRRITGNERRHLTSQYDGAIAHLDSEFGKLIARLKELGLYENSLLIVTSDHGEALGDRNIVDHQTTVYQDQVHVPLLIKYPGQSRGAVVAEAVSLVDVLPTVMDTLGMEIPSGLHGRSLREITPGSRTDVIAEAFPSDWGASPWRGRFLRAQRALFRGSLKFISSPAGKKELYDLSIDPEERANLYDPSLPAFLQMNAGLDAWVKRVPADPGQSVKPERRLIERLRGLGYLR